MKPSKSNVTIKSRRKPSTTSEAPLEKHSTKAGRRTRSSNTVDSMAVQRSTRSAHSNAFFELPYNYGSKKSQEANLTPQKRIKRSSTYSSSSSLSSEGEQLSPTAITPKKAARRSSARLAGISPALSEKENFSLVNGNLRLKVTLEQSLSSVAIKSDAVCTNGIESDDHLVKNLEAKSPIITTSSMTNGLKPITDSKSRSALGKRPFSDSDATPVKCSSDVNTSARNTVPRIHNDVKSDTKRRRHFSENVYTSSGRVRRLSERGEMASVMEFVFKKSRPVPISSLASTKDTSDIRRKALRSSKVHHDNSSKLKNSLKTEQKNCPNPSSVQKIANDLHKDSKTENKHHIFRSNHSSESQSDPAILSATCSSETKTTTKQTGTLVDIKANANSSLECNELSTNSSHNAVIDTANSVIPELSNGLELYQDKEEKTCFKWRQRSLRSSGIKCQPDFYALSLNLMIHRVKKTKPHLEENNKLTRKISRKDTQVFSDSEVEFLKKSPIDSCIFNDFHSQTSATSIVKLKESESKQESSDQSPINFSETDLQTDMVPSHTQVQISQSDDILSPPSSSPSNKSKIKNKVKGRSKSSLKSFTHKSQVQSTKSLEALEPPSLFDEEPPTGPEVYYFESDHVALKHNQDYHSILRAASLLAAQHKRALNDLEILQQRMQEAMHDPVAFVDKLQRKVDLDLPSEQTVPPLPSIEWSKYTSPFGTFENVFSQSTSSSPVKPHTRRKKINFALKRSYSQSKNKVRSETFKKSWTIEEQRQLEELLIKYPQETVEFNRYRKIASELGGRTPLQVQSRVQKYFIKLAKAGMAIPGRMPHFERHLYNKPRGVRHRSHQHASLARMSTFFSDFHVPVKMRDDDDEPPQDGVEEDDGGWERLQLEQVSDEEDVPEELRLTNEYLEILRLKRQRKEQLQLFNKNGQQVLAQHFGYQCDACEMEPIKGVRYHCIDCPPSESVDLCQSCIRSQSKFESSTHKSNHRMEAVYTSVVEDSGDSLAFRPSTRPYTDADYTNVASSSGEYNYLDPNFIPTTR